MTPPRMTRRRLIAASVLAPMANLARPQGGAFPDRPLHLIVPAPPGGVQDVQSRRLVPRLGELLRQPVIVDNRPGASGSLALEQLLRSAPDGYTMAMAPVGITVIPHLQKTPYDTLKDFAAVSRFSAGPYVLVAPASAPYDDFAGLVAHARRKGGASIGGFGNGTLAHLTVLLLGRATGVAFRHVPYTGGQQQVTDLIGGQLDALLDFTAIVRQHVEAGRMKALGTTGRRRVAPLPEVRTLIEQGVAGLDVVAWQGVVVPAATPSSVVRRLNAAWVDAMKDPAQQAQFSADGAELGADEPAQFDAFIRSEYARWGKVIREHGVMLQ